VKIGLLIAFAGRNCGGPEVFEREIVRAITAVAPEHEYHLYCLDRRAEAVIRVPADRVAAMSQAMMDTFKDPDFVAEAEKRGLGVSSPRSGKELQELLTQVYTKTPPSIIERLRKISTP